jgi:hypothetical protein
MSQFRVIRTTISGSSNPTVTTDVIWEGDYVDDLEKQYPPSDIFGADPLGRLEIEDGWIRFAYTFEEYVNGAWLEIEDPRELTANRPMRDYEREIDAQNRRDFPGDYITSDCDRCGDYGCDECEPDPYR